MKQTERPQFAVKSSTCSFFYSAWRHLRKVYNMVWHTKTAGRSQSPRCWVCWPPDLLEELLIWTKVLCMLQFVETGGCWTMPAPTKPLVAHTQPPVPYWNPSSSHHRPQLLPSTAKGIWMSFCVALERRASCSGVLSYITLAAPAAGKGQSKLINAVLTLIMFVEQCCKGAFWQACPSSATSFFLSFAFQNHTLLSIKRKWQSITVCQDRKKAVQGHCIVHFDFSSPFLPMYRIFNHCPVETDLYSSLKATAEVAAWNSSCCKESFLNTMLWSLCHLKQRKSATTATLQTIQAFTTEKVCFPQRSGHILSFTFDLLMQWESNSSREKEDYIQAGGELGGSCSWAEEGWLKAQVIGRD